MRRSALSALFLTAAALAQNPADLFNKPPAEVDQALRARINEFYEYHVKQQFRKAEELVAEETKDFFYSHNKPQYLSFEIKSIQYSDNFTKAKVTMVCEQYVMMPGFTDRPMKVPSPSTWKIENGKWMWYIDPESFRDSPFGKMTAGKGPGAGPSGLPTIPADPSFVLKQVKVDKSVLTLKKGESAEILVTNGASGMVGVSVSNEIPGIEAKLERSDLKPGESVKLTVKAGDRATTEGGSFELYVSPTGETIPVQVAVKADPNSPREIAPAKVTAPTVALKQVKLDKSMLTIRKGQSAEVVVTNNAAGTVGLSVNNKIVGIDAKLGRRELKSGESVKLTIKVGYKVSGGGFVAITVSPTGEILPVQVIVK